MNPSRLGFDFLFIYKKKKRKEKRKKKVSVIVLCVSQYEAHLSPAAIGFGHRSAKEKAEFLRFGYLRLSSVIFWAFFMFLIFGSRFWFRCSHINRRFLRPILPGTMSLVFCFEFCFVLFVFFFAFSLAAGFYFPQRLSWRT